MVGLLLGVLSAILWVALDAMRKDISEDVPPSGLLVGLHWPQLPLLLLLLVWGSWRPGTGAPDDPWTLMVGSGGVPAQALEWSYLAPASVALIFALVANLLFLRAVQLSPLSLTIPYLSFTPIFSAIGAFIIDGEAPTPWGWLGIAIVSGGAFLLNPGDRDQGLMAPLKAIWTERGSLYMLGVAFCWSVTAVVDSRAAGVTSATWHTLMLTLGILASVVVYRLVRDRSARPLLSELRQRTGFQATAGLMLLGAMVIQMTAYNILGVAYVETLKRAAGVVGSIVLGYLFFGETDLGQRLVAALIISVGVAILILGG